MQINISPKCKADIKSLHKNYINSRCMSIKNGQTQNRKTCLIKELDDFEIKYSSSHAIPSNLGNTFFSDLNDITCGEFSQLDAMKQKYSCLHIDHDIVHKKEEDRNEYENDLIELGDKIQEFLDYSGFSKAQFSAWGARKFISMLHESVCPYCNAQYIYVSSRDDGIKPQIDHLFPQAENPIFSCSIFNMIPSCYNCNHSKSDQEDSILSPYERGFMDDAVFSIKAERQDRRNIDKIDLNKNIDIYLKVINVTNKSEIENAKKLFKLDDLYNCHQEELIDLLQRIKKNNKIKIKNNRNIYRLLGSEKEIKKLILGIPLEFESKNYLFKKLKDDFWKRFHK